jgi:hypothetical protein
MDGLLDEWKRKIATPMPEKNLDNPARNRSLQKAEVERKRHLLWPGSSYSPVILATLFLQQVTGLILMTQAQSGRTPVDRQVQGTEAWLVLNQT